MAAGAALDRVHIVSAVRNPGGKGQRTFNLQTDIELLERKIAKIGDVALVIVDPVSSYLGKTDSHKNSEVRGVLEPLSEMAERTRVAILSITHFNKIGANGTTKAMHRFYRQYCIYRRAARCLRGNRGSTRSVPQVIPTCQEQPAGLSLSPGADNCRRRHRCIAGMLGQRAGHNNGESSPSRRGCRQRASQRKGRGRRFPKHNSFEWPYLAKANQRGG